MKPVKTKTVSLTQLTNILGAVTHAQPISFTALTDARPRKTNLPFASVQKLTKVSAFTGTDYTAAVNRQMTREGNGDAPAFAAQERAWGNRISPALVSKLDEKTGQVRFYLPAQIQRASKPLYLVPKSGRLTAVPKEAVAPWLPKDKTPEVAAAQGVEKAIIYRDYSLSSLTTLTLDGQRYRIRQEA